MMFPIRRGFSFGHNKNSIRQTGFLRDSDRILFKVSRVIVALLVRSLNNRKHALGWPLTATVRTMWPQINNATRIKTSQTSLQAAPRAVEI